MHTQTTIHYPAPHVPRMCRRNWMAVTKQRYAAHMNAMHEKCGWLVSRGTARGSIPTSILVLLQLSSGLWVCGRGRPGREFITRRKKKKKKGFSLAIWEGRFVDFHFTKHGSRLNLSTRPKLLFRYSVTAITPRSHRGDPGSTPGIGVHHLFF